MTTPFRKDLSPDVQGEIYNKWKAKDKKLSSMQQMIIVYVN